MTAVRHFLKSVLLLGAGATLAESMRQRPRDPRKNHPPLNGGFFRLTRDRQPSSRQLADVHTYMRDRHGIDIFSGAGDFVETAMVRIVSDYDFASRRDQRTLKAALAAAFVSLLKIYVDTIARTTVRLRASKNSYLHRAIGHALRQAENPSDVTIVTFNHDMEAEKTLSHMTDFQRWGNELLAMPFSYGNDIASLRLFGDRGRGDKYEVLKSAPANFVKVLKLHGSLNWASLHKPRSANLARLLSPARTVR